MMHALNGRVLGYHSPIMPTSHYDLSKTKTNKRNDVSGLFKLVLHVCIREQVQMSVLGHTVSNQLGNDCL